MLRLVRNCCLLWLILLQSTPGSASVPKLPTAFVKNYSGKHDICDSAISDQVLFCRGGASRSKKKSSKKSSSKRTATGKKQVGAKSEEQAKSSALSDTLKKYKQILPLTRIYISMVGLTTLLGLVLGDELSQGLLALDPMRLLYGLEIWRPFTAASFLGPPSIGWLMSGYYLFEYGSSLERAYGTPQHLMFLLSQVALLSIFSVLFGMPFFGQSMITAMVHVLSRALPKQKVKWIIFTVPYWTLPYGLMLSDVLQAQNAAAAVPHVLGILAGHFYHFHKFVWPKVGGEDWLVAPGFVVNMLTPKASTPKPVVTKRKKGRKLTAKK
ncbi:Derlin 1 [Seminavis robusta]|uniref:Derlin n=1 Tax=Seminavis robusta TaxID=568900 RepID=A0A9N8DRX2_9STRA|nr:Derlin 1 [Seminavis robusta]|eukprot:Sro245_g097400.1 Derlin 1 (325) ;mRNA; r:43191-44165